MIIDIVQAVVSVLGVTVAAAGFYSVSRQLRKSSHSDIYALGVATKQALLNHPDLRCYFFDGVGPNVDDANKRSRILTLTDMFCLYLEQVAVYADDLGGEKTAWFTYIRNMHASSPAIREYIQQIPYAPALYEAIGISRQTNENA